MSYENRFYEEETERKDFEHSVYAASDKEDAEEALAESEHDAVFGHTEPTYANQLWQAEKIMREQGKEELARHAAIGRDCGCQGCFCCAARELYDNA